MSKYRTIVADPPWPIDAFPEWGDGKGTIVTPYPTMSLEDIAALDVGKYAEPWAHLYVWTINEFLEDTCAIVRKWGFEKTATLVWCKEPRGERMGGVFASNVEFVLFCRKRGGDEVLRITSYLAEAAKAAGISRKAIDQHMGTSDMAGWWLSLLPHRCAVPKWEQWLRLKQLLGFGDELDDRVQELERWRNEERPVSNTRWFQWARGPHSRKPEAFLDLVEQVSPSPRLEMFARRNRLGWDTWGNEALNHVEVQPGASA